MKNHGFLLQVSTPAAFGLALLLAAAAAQAQAPTPEQMAQMMKMQQCMAEMDPKVMERLEARGKKFEAEVKALCAAGKRDEAQSKAMAYGREMAASEELKAMKKCGDMASQMMPPSAARATGGGDKGRALGNICDEQ